MFDYLFTQLISNVNRIKAIFMVIPQLNDHYTQFLTYQVLTKQKQEKKRDKNL